MIYILDKRTSSQTTLYLALNFLFQFAMRLLQWGDKKFNYIESQKQELFLISIIHPYIWDKQWYVYTNTFRKYYSNLDNPHQEWSFLWSYKLLKFVLEMWDGYRLARLPSWDIVQSL